MFRRSIGLSFTSQYIRSATTPLSLQLVANRNVAQLVQRRFHQTCAGAGAQQPVQTVLEQEVRSEKANSSVTSGRGAPDDATPEARLTASVPSKGEGSDSGKPSKGKGKETEKNQPSPRKEELFLSCSLATTGRSPTDGWIMSLGFCAMTLQKQIVDVFSENLLPLAPGASIGAPEVLGVWRKSKDELMAVMEGAKPPAVVFQALIAWAKNLSKTYTLTLIGNPTLTVFGFLHHYMSVCVPEVKNPPWGISGTCVTSFCCGVAGVAPRSYPSFAKWAEGLTPNMIPANDCVVGAVTFVNALRDAMKLPPAGPFTWAANVNPPPCFGRVPRAIDLKVLDDAVQLPFARYPSIVNPNVDEALLQEAALNAEQWVATEKVHGANLSIITDGSHVRVGRRTGLLKLSEASAFFGFDLVVGRLMPNILKLHSSLSADPSLAAIADESGKALRLASISIFGELAGGEYAHPLVAPHILGHKVQSGVQYAPFNFFYAFDVALNYCATEGDPSEPQLQSVAKSVFLPFDRLCQVLDAAGILRAQEKFRGSFSEAIKLSPEFTSDLPARFGLPPLSSENHAEGLIIRPVNDIWVDRGPDPVDAPKKKKHASKKASKDEETTGQLRVLFKLKHPKFYEMVGSNAPARDAAIEVIALSMINEGRLASVLSKLTLDERANSDKVAELLVLDALTDATTFKAKAVKDKGKGKWTDDGSKTAGIGSISPEARGKLFAAAKAVVSASPPSQSTSGKPSQG